MATFTPVIASGSTNGKMVKIAATSTPGTTLHTAIAGTDNIDEITVEAFNSDATVRTLVIEFGGVASPDDLVQFNLPIAPGGPYLIIGGWRLNNGLLVRAFCATTNVIVCQTTVNRYTA
jgi:hypothetical protein